MNQKLLALLRRSLAAGLVLVAGLATGAVSRAAPRIQEASLAGLEAALESRLSVLPGLDPEEVFLREALARLRAYGGSLASYAAIEDDPRALYAAKLDVDRLRGVAENVQASHTPAAPIHAQMSAVRDTLFGFGAQIRQAALGRLPLLLDAEVRDSIAELVASADPRAERGFALFGRLRRYRLGAGLLGQAASDYYAADRQAEEQRLKEASTNPIDLKPMDLVLPTEPPKSMIPFEVDAMVQLTRPAPELTVAVRAIAVDEAPGSPLPPQLTLGTKTFLGVPAGTYALPVTVEIPPFVDESATTSRNDDASNIVLDTAIDGNTAVVARAVQSARGSVDSYVSILERNAGGFGAWHEVQRISLEAPAGVSLAISRDTLVLGRVVGSGDRGEARVYQRQGDTFVFVKTLRGSDGVAGDLFGASVAIDGDWILVGAPLHAFGGGIPHPSDSTRGGTAYTFRRDAGGPGNWGQVNDLAHGLEEVNQVEHCSVLHCPVSFLCYLSHARVFPGLQFFGASVAIHDGLAVVGDPFCRVDFDYDGDEPYGVSLPPCYPLEGQSVGTGAAFVFRLSGSDWVPIPNTGWVGPERPYGGGPSLVTNQNSRMGGSVALAGETLVVGAPEYDGFGPQDAGAVFVYSIVGSGSAVTLQRRLSAPSPMPGDTFGTDVAISDDGGPLQTIVVGSPGHDHPYGGPIDAGSIYLFVRGHRPGCPNPMTPPGGWGLLARRVAEEPMLGGRFGTRVAIDPSSVALDPNQLIEELNPTTVIAANGGAGLPWVRIFSGMEPVLAGQYWLELEVDPFDRILEIADGTPGGNVMRAPVPVTFCVPALDQPDLAVDAVQAVPVDPATSMAFVAVIREDDGSGTLGPPEQRTKFGLNVTLHMAGMFDGPLSGARLTARASGPGYDVPLKLWNATTGAYEPSFLVPNLSTGDTLSMHIDAELGDLQALPIPPAGQPSESYPLDVRVALTAPSGVTDVNGANNTRSQPGQELRVLQFRSCNFVQRFEKQLGNDDVNASLDLLGALGLADPLPDYGLFDTLSQRGAIGALGGGASLTLMGHDVGRLAEFRALAERDPTYVFDPNLHPGMDPGYQFIAFDVRALGQTIYAIGPYDTFDIGELQAHPPTGFEVDAVDGGFRLTRSLSVSKGVEREKTFYPGGVPVTVAVRAQGTIAFDTALTVADAVRFDVGPHVDFSAGVSFAVGPCDISCVGADGELTIVADTFTVTGALGMQVTPPTWLDHPDPAAEHSLGANACFTVTNTITLLNGRLSAFAIYPWFKFCRVLGVPLPCGITTRRSDFPIVEWSGPEYTQTLFDRNVNLCCTPIVGVMQCEPNSFLCQ